MHYAIFLLALLRSVALAAKESAYTKSFVFKEDVFLLFNPLPTAIGPDASVDVLMAALDDFSQQFIDVWTAEINSNLQEGSCEVKYMSTPEWEICDWKYPDRYDVDELPTPGQCYKYENGFVQRVYYKIEELEITCPEDFSYSDLDKDGYTLLAFSGNDFLDVINPPDTECTNEDPLACLFDNATTAEWAEGYDVCNAELFINRFVDVPVYLKCLDQGYGPEIADKIIAALDLYFDQVISEVIAEEVMTVAPEGFIYNFASPYASDREFCAHGSFYTGGNLVNQAPGPDGVMVTKFTIGFDMIWFKPRDFDDEMLPDMEEVLNRAFEDGDFLLFLQEEYGEIEGYDFIQDIEECDVIPPDEATFTLAPTEEPTPQPTEGPVCDVDTNEGCPDDQFCRLSCVWLSDEPQCFANEVVRDCEEEFGGGWICVDTDELRGCQFIPPTQAPFEAPTPFPVVNTSTPTISPTLRPTSLSPTVSSAPSAFIHPSSSPSVTSMPSNIPTPIPTSRLPTLNPTAPATPGNTPTLGNEKTIIPAETLLPTISPVEMPSTPGPTCPPGCIVTPDDTEEDECPLVTTGTCGDGNRGDGICPYDGHCCSEWGWCGTTAEHCEDASDIAPTPSNVDGAPAAPTASTEGGQCANGDVGDGFCPEENQCCSQYGWCGEGEQYCFTTIIYDEETGDESAAGTCGGGGVGDGQCGDGQCCSEFGFCGEGELYCTGQNTFEESDALAEDTDTTLKSSPLPENLQPGSAFRCGFTEVDARSNCKPLCTTLLDCSDGEECWGVALNYCNTYEEGEHPICTNLELADNDSRCGYDEASARGHCGAKCTSSDECGEGEFCFPTWLNLCECHEETCPEESAFQFAKAKALLMPYFVESDPNTSVEGMSRNASFKTNLSIASSLLLVFASMHVLW